jgi:hypothetical protein
MQTVTVPLSDTVHRRLKRAAEIAGKPIDEIAAQSIQESLPPLLDVIPARFRADLQAMESLSDSDLWKLSRITVEVKDQRRYKRLLKKKALGALTERERQALSELRTLADKVMLQKAYAYLLLKWRGYRVPTLANPRYPNRPVT